MNKPTVFISLLVIGLLLTAFISLGLGRYPVAIPELYNFIRQILLNCPNLDDQRFLILKNILFNIRLPRIVAAMLIGAALSAAGVTFQSMFMNPLVSPGLLGVLAGASFGAALGMVFAKTWVIVQIGAVVFGLLAVAAAIGVAAIYRGDRLLMLILGGIISGALFTSLLSILKYLADPQEKLPAIVYWLMGGLSMSDGKTVWVVALPISTGIAMLTALSGYMNLLSMGDEEARSLGVNVRLIRFLLIFFSTVISALTVVLGGIIGWVGLVIPHISRMLIGPNNRVLLPSAALIGAIYLLVVDDFSRMLFRVEIPLGILTSLVGIPFFAFVLRNAKKGWS